VVSFPRIVGGLSSAGTPAREFCFCRLPASSTLLLLLAENLLTDRGGRNHSGLAVPLDLNKIALLGVSKFQMAFVGMVQRFADCMRQMNIRCLNDDRSLGKSDRFCCGVISTEPNPAPAATSKNLSRV